MIVVADTGPLRYRVEIESDAIVPVLFEQVAIPAAVAEELGAKGAPEIVRRWVAEPPHWVHIREEPSAFLLRRPREGSSIWGIRPNVCRKKNFRGTPVLFAGTLELARMRASAGHSSPKNLPGTK